ncbi:MAG: hypothetical protein LQ350_002890 [Teloschistes chrysophthalmus]|nr:MAG: hypothetical protein LQ350_002890 [Niorma chrysophthalma]
MRMPISGARGDPEFDVPQSLRAERKSSILDLFSASNAHSGKSHVIAASRAASLSTSSPSGASRTAATEILPREQSPANEPESPGLSTAAVSSDVDGLVSQLDQTKIETAAPSASRIIEVGNGFPLGMAFDVSKFYHIRSDFRRLDKRKRDLGILPRMAGRQKHGFRPEELVYHDAILMFKDCQGSDLDDEIHPLLHRDSFDDTPDHVYDQLVPGLRLATRFLSHPSCMQFWVTLAKGERRVDHEMSRRCGATRHRISRNAPMTKENVTEVIRYMKELGIARTFHFTFANGLLFQGGAAFGTANMVCDYQSEHNESQQCSRQSSSLQRCNIRLHSDFYVVAKKLSTLQYPDPPQKLRFNFVLATLIVHELAHAIELSQWRNRAPSPYEPFLLHHNEAELGRMWETYVFGGQVTPINDRVDGLYGVSTWTWPRSFGELDPERTICYALPMTYIQKLQQKATWEQRTDLNNTKAFWAPREGATSIYMNSVTTVSWTEEERVAKEALNEQRNLEIEEPARKRREAADGHAVGIKDLAAEPEVVEKPIVNEEKGNTAQQVLRVKLEPRSVLSRRKWRQIRKLAQKQSNTEQTEQAQPPATMEETPPTAEIIPQLDGPTNLNKPTPENTSSVKTEVAAEAMGVQDENTTAPMSDAEEVSSKDPE